MDGVLVFIFLFLIILMLAAIASALKIASSDRVSQNGFIAVALLDGKEDTEKRISQIINKVMWTDEELIRCVILADGGLSHEQAEICRRYCSRYDYLFFSSPDEIGSIILEIRKNNIK